MRIMIISKKNLELETRNLEEFWYVESASTSDDGKRYTRGGMRSGMYRIWLESCQKSDGQYIYELSVLANDNECSEGKSLALLNKHGYAPFEYDGHAFPEDFTEVEGEYCLTGSEKHKAAVLGRVSKLAKKDQQAWADAVEAHDLTLADVAGVAKKDGYLRYESFGRLKGEEMSVVLLREYPELKALANKGSFPRELQQELFGEIELADLKLFEGKSVDEALQIFVAKHGNANESECEYLANLPLEERRKFARKAGEFGCYSAIELWADCGQDFLDGLFSREEIPSRHDLFRYLLPQESLRAQVVQQYANRSEIAEYYEKEYRWADANAERDQLLIRVCLPAFRDAGMPAASVQKIGECCATYARKQVSDHSGLDKMAHPISLLYAISAVINTQAQLEELLQHLAQKFTVDVDGDNFWAEKFVKDLQQEGVPDSFFVSLYREMVTGIERYDQALAEILPEAFKAEILKLSTERARQDWQCEFEKDTNELFCLENAKLSRGQVKNLLKNDRRIFHAIVCSEAGEKDGRSIKIDNLSKFLFGVPGHAGAIRVQTLRDKTLIDVRGQMSIQAIELLRDILQSSYRVAVKSAGVARILGK